MTSGNGHPKQRTAIIMETSDTEATGTVRVSRARHACAIRRITVTCSITSLRNKSRPRQRI